MLGDRPRSVDALLLLTSLVTLAACSSDGDASASQSSAGLPSAVAPSPTSVAMVPTTSTIHPTTRPVPRSLKLDIVGACNEATFFARSEDDTVAVSISYDATDRATSQPTVISFTLPDPRLSVFLTHGTALSQALCADITNEAYSRATEDEVRSGFGTLSIDPPPTSAGSCGATGGVHGELHIEGLTDRDGTPIEPIDVSTDLIGCIV
jgi:hypothetical protein